MRFITVLLGLIFGLTAAFAQTGAWYGNLKVQNIELPLVFHFEDENPTLDSPAQGARGIPMEMKRADNKIIVQIPVIGASYEGVVINGKIEGSFKQGGLEFPLTLTAEEVKVNRPQTPQPPFPYTQEEVTFANGDALLKGTLVLPESYDIDTPVVIMITGSGLQNRDEELFQHKPFAVIADALARQGIASLRYDDRGFGESSGDVVNCTTEDFKNDAKAGVEMLKKRFHHVGALGHSEGGTIALMLGTDNDVDFIVSLAGMSVAGSSTLIDQNRNMLISKGVPQNIADNYCRLLSDTFKAISHEEASPDPDQYNLPQSLITNYKEALQQLQTPYFKYFINLDIAPILNDIKVPVLALNGTKDTQVDCKSNLETLRKGLPHNPVNVIKSVEGVNHLFQHCQTGLLEEYGSIEETMVPEVLSQIADWINSLQ